MNRIWVSYVTAQRKKKNKTNVRTNKNKTREDVFFIFNFYHFLKEKYCLEICMTMNVCC